MTDSSPPAPHRYHTVTSQDTIIPRSFYANWHTLARVSKTQNSFSILPFSSLLLTKSFSFSLLSELPLSSLSHCFTPCLLLLLKMHSSILPRSTRWSKNLLPTHRNHGLLSHMMPHANMQWTIVIVIQRALESAYPNFTNNHVLDMCIARYVLSFVLY